MQANDHVARARALVGTRFRPQGHNPDHGLDCVGLVVTVFDLGQTSIRRDYRLRGRHRAELQNRALIWFRPISRRQCRPGDVLLCAVAADQIHLAIQTEAGFIHADAGLGYIVETPGTPTWPILAVFRKRIRRTQQKAI